MIPVLLRPKVLAVTSGISRGRVGGRGLVVTILSVFVMVSIFQATTEFITILNSSNSSTPPHPTVILSATLGVLFLMLLFANGLSALGALYLSDDLEFILSTPISTTRFFTAKTIEVAFSAGWMSGIFSMPILVALGRGFEASLEYYLLLPVVLVPYFLTPALIAIIAVTVCAALLPAGKTRELLALAFACSLTGLYLLLRLINLSPSSNISVQMDRMAGYLNLSRLLIPPANAAARILGETIQAGTDSQATAFLLLFGYFAIFSALALLTVRCLHPLAYSKAQDHDQRTIARHLSTNFVRHLFTDRLNPLLRGLAAKEWRLFLRDISQGAQLILLLGLCLIYLYNFRVIHTLESASHLNKALANGLLIAANAAMGCFIITAISTRFVFPSVSMEGRAVWIPLSAPISNRDFLRGKFLCWFLPVAIMATIVLSAGALAIDAAPGVILASALVSWPITFGLVGLAIGLGALFANFEWDHHSQLAASAGSMLFMMVSIALVFLNLVPISALIFISTLEGEDITFSPWQLKGAAVACAIIVCYLNFSVARWSLTLGEHSLNSRRES